MRTIQKKALIIGIVMMLTIALVLGIGAASLTAGSTEGTNLSTQGGGLGNGQGNGRGNGRGQGRGNGSGTFVQGQGLGNGGADNEDLTLLLKDIPSSPLSAFEKETLLALREEEKLARDVYQTLYKTWNMPTFQNIGGSEQSHMDSLKFLLDRYGLADPVGTNAVGVYKNPAFTKLYTDLVAKGKKSLTDAFAVGATVEDLDIADLEAGRVKVDNKDIQILYQNLAKASRNHLRSFVGQLERAGGSYQAQYISKTYLATTLKIARETAPITDPAYNFSK